MQTKEELQSRYSCYNLLISIDYLCVKNSERTLADSLLNFVDIPGQADLPQYSNHGSAKSSGLIDPVLLDHMLLALPEPKVAGEIQVWFAEDENALAQLSPLAANEAMKSKEEDLFQQHVAYESLDPELKEVVASVHNKFLF